MGAEAIVEAIKDLRARTGAGMVDCKNALAASEGDLTRAIDYLRRKGLATATKKAGRETSEGVVGSYIHAGGKIGVLVEVNCETDFVARTSEFQGLVRDLAMQVAGANPPPRYVRPEDVPSEVIEREKAIYFGQTIDLKKPENVTARIVEGKIGKFLQDVCLMEQTFIKDPQLTIKEFIALKVAKMGENIQIRRFARYQLGEGDSTK